MYIKPIRKQSYTVLVQPNIDEDGNLQPMVIDSKGGIIVDSYGYIQSLKACPSGVNCVGQKTQTSGIQEAINYVQNLGGDKVFIKSGTYNIYTNLQINQGGISIEGELVGGINYLLNQSDPSTYVGVRIIQNASSTVLMYFSIMVPNWNTNTKSIYVYKFPVSLLKSSQSINQYAVSGLTPTTTSTPPPNDKPYFLGGLTLDQAFTQSFSIYSSTAIGISSVFSAPQFTISFDYMKLTAPFGYQLSNGYLPALLVAVEGYMPFFNYPHGDGILVTLLQDIHANPANPTVFRWPYTVYSASTTTYYIPFASHAIETDTISTGVAVDKFGSILPMQSIGLNGGYIVPLTTPSRGDVKLSSMRVKLMYILPTVSTGGNIELTGIYPPTPWFTLAVTDSIVDPVYPTMGLCRPYVTTLPDGKAKVLLGGYHADNYIEGAAVYVDPKVLKPDYHKKLYALPVNFPILNTNSVITWYTGAFGMDPVLISNFGKKKVKVSFQGIGGGAYKFLGVMKWDPISAQFNLPISPVNANTGNYLVTTGNQYIQLTGINGNSSIEFYVAQSDVIPNGNWANTQSNAEFEIELNNNIWALTLVYFAYRAPEVVLEDE